AIVASRFELSQPDWQDKQPPSGAPGRRLAQGDSTPPDCSGLDATLSRRLRDKIISEPECEREVVPPPPDEGSPPSRRPGTGDPPSSSPPGDEEEDVIAERPSDEDPNGGGTSSNDLGKILGPVLGLGLGIAALVGVLYLVKRSRRQKLEARLAAAERMDLQAWRKPRTQENHAPLSLSLFRVRSLSPTVRGNTGNAQPARLRLWGLESRVHCHTQCETERGVESRVRSFLTTARYCVKLKKP
ncbi:hypothetical protein DUNSADRAFT_17678, partial [Dunaliella salina]